MYIPYQLITDEYMMHTKHPPNSRRQVDIVDLLSSSCGLAKQEHPASVLPQRKLACTAVVIVYMVQLNLLNNADLKWSCDYSSFLSVSLAQA